MEESVNRLTVVANMKGLLIDNPQALYENYVDAKTPLWSVYVGTICPGQVTAI